MLNYKKYLEYFECEGYDRLYTLIKETIDSIINKPEQLIVLYQGLYDRYLYYENTDPDMEYSQKFLEVYDKSIDYLLTHTRESGVKNMLGLMQYFWEGKCSAQIFKKWQSTKQPLDMIVASSAIGMCQKYEKEGPASLKKHLYTMLNKTDRPDILAMIMNAVHIRLLWYIDNEPNPEFRKAYDDILTYYINVIHNRLSFKNQLISMKYSEELSIN